MISRSVHVDVTRARARFGTIVLFLWYSRTVLERSQTPTGMRARDRILIAAERLIAERGFYGTSMRDIASAARLPLATTVYHFAKKEQLYASILGDIAAAHDTRLQAAMFERYERDIEHTTNATTATAAMSPRIDA